jgi:hypothetical protein
VARRRANRMISDGHSLPWRLGVKGRHFLPRCLRERGLDMEGERKGHPSRQLEDDLSRLDAGAGAAS